MFARLQCPHPSQLIQLIRKLLNSLLFLQVHEESLPIADLVRKATETNDLLFLVEEVYNRWQLQHCHVDISEQETALPYIIELKESD